MTSMLAADRERLTRWAARDEVHRPTKSRPINVSDIFRHNRPVADMLNPARAIERERSYSVVVSFDEQLVVESGTRETQREATAATK
jgi:hypothetical protein